MSNGLCRLLFFTFAHCKVETYTLLYSYRVTSYSIPIKSSLLSNCFGGNVQWLLSFRTARRWVCCRMRRETVQIKLYLYSHWKCIIMQQHSIQFNNNKNVAKHKHVYLRCFFFCGWLLEIKRSSIQDCYVYNEDHVKATLVVTQCMGVLWLSWLCAGKPSNIVNTYCPKRKNHVSVGGGLRHGIIFYLKVNILDPVSSYTPWNKLFVYQ